MAGKPKVVRKAEKATVRAASTSRVDAVNGPRKDVIKDLDKSIKANKRAGTKISASSVPGSVADRNRKAKGDGSKRSSAQKTLAKRVNQSVVARGGAPSKTYVSKGRAAKTAGFIAKMDKRIPAFGGTATKKEYLSKKKLDGRGGYN